MKEKKISEKMAERTVFDEISRFNMSLDIPSHQFAISLAKHTKELEVSIEQAIKKAVGDFNYERSIRESFYRWMHDECQQAVRTWLNHNKEQVLSRVIDNVLGDVLLAEQVPKIKESP